MRRKKFAQGLVTGLLSLALCASVAPLGASAATYDRHDVNHDGKINVDDYYYLTDYLAGKFSVVSPTALDVNQNKVIDSADAYAVMARSYGAFSTVEFVDITRGLTPVQTIPDELLAESVGSELFPSEEDIFEPDVISGQRTCYKYDCTKGTYTSYILIPPLDMETASLSMNELDSINVTSISDYYRVNGNGMDGIVRLIGSCGNSTGFIIDDHIIATAAHCVYDEIGATVRDRFCDDLQVWLCDTEGNVTSEKCTVKELHIPKAYADSPSPGKNGNSCDYALITVEEDLSEYTHFNLGVASTDDLNNMDEVPLILSGFPRDAKVSNRVYTSVGQEYNDRDSDEQHLYYTNKAADGMSGAPLYVVTDIYQNGRFYNRINTAVAVHSAASSSCKFGVAMNSYMLIFYKNNSYVSY